ncbi:MAG: GNAT family N-acetyltransferase [Bacteroidia bacterium]|nr:GNAT family N-acetyltransferase [Bacteroidia bacterium]HQV00364.1 GNAT family N-acetyltransferase [Bacteroidia bacterium]
MHTNIEITPGTTAHVEAAFALVKELAEFENGLDQVSNTASQMLLDGFGPDPCFSLLVALENQVVVGIAIYFTKYSTWKGKGIYLEDIVVTKAHRGKGIGKMLFDAVWLEAQKQNAHQLHWQVLDWNKEAISFYKKYPATFDQEWINCKICW